MTVPRLIFLYGQIGTYPIWPVTSARDGYSRAAAHGGAGRPTGTPEWDEN